MQDKPIFTPADDTSEKTEEIKNEPKPLHIKDPDDDLVTDIDTEEKPAEEPKPIEKPKPNPDEDLAETMFPCKKSSSGSRVATTIALVAVAFIAVGFIGGFLGFKYSPRFANLITTAADTDASVTTETGTPLSTNATPSDVSLWPIYTNTTYLYSIKYPDNWYSQNTDDPTALTVTLTNFAPQSKTNTEEKVEVIIENIGVTDLKTWIDTQSTILQNVATLTKLTVSGTDAYQQETTGTNHAITTFIKQGNYVIKIVYTADSGVFNDGKAIYDTILASFKLS